MSNQNVILVATDSGYLPYFNALINSLAKHGNKAEVVVIHHGLAPQYIHDTSSRMPFRVIFVPVDRSVFLLDPATHADVDDNLFFKQSRFRYIKEYGSRYEVSCILDADMFVVSPGFFGLFDLARSTRKLIGCNERFKWLFDERYQFNGKPILPSPVKAFKFHCSVPLILDINQWSEVFDTYNELAFNAYEVRPGTPRRRVGDMYCWNLAVYKHRRQGDVVVFPMETMTQVHSTAGLPWTRVIRHTDGIWTTQGGDEVYTIHGRIGKRDWIEGEVAAVQKKLAEFGIGSPAAEKIWEGARSSYQAIRREWYALNFEQLVRLHDYVPMTDEWRQMKDG